MIQHPFIQLYPFFQILIINLILLVIYHNWLGLSQFLLCRQKLGPTGLLLGIHLFYAIFHTKYRTPICSYKPAIITNLRPYHFTFQAIVLVCCSTIYRFSLTWLGCNTLIKLFAILQYIWSGILSLEFLETWTLVDIATISPSLSTTTHIILDRICLFCKTLLISICVKVIHIPIPDIIQNILKHIWDLVKINFSFITHHCYSRILRFINILLFFGAHLCLC